MRKKVIVSILSVVGLTMLVGCKLGTPFGTLKMEFDSEAQTDGIHYTDDKGNTQEIKTDDVNKQIDTMLETVDLPNDTSTDQLKDFVHSASDTLGVTEQVDNIQNTIDKAKGKTVSEDKVAEPKDETDINVFDRQDEPLIDKNNITDIMDLNQ